MTKQQFYRALFVLMTALGCLFIAILFVLITKDDWYLFGTLEIIVTVVFFATIPFMCWTSYQYGKQAERNRHRARIKSVIDKYAPYISQR